MLGAPIAVDGLPFLNGEPVDSRGNTVMLACADEVLGEITSSNIPIGAQLLEVANVTNHGHIRLGLDSEICVAELVGPLIVGVGKDEGRFA